MTETTTTQELVRCTGCHRPLTAAASRLKKIGRTCERNARKAAAVLGFKPAAIEKAKELIEQGGIIALRAKRIFKTVSSDGTRTYLTAKEACNCAAGLKAKHVCFHRVAVVLLAA